MKKQQRWAIGEDNGNAVLSKEEVLAIRHEYEKWSRSRGLPALARRYGVSKDTIRQVVKRITWKEIENG